MRYFLGFLIAIGIIVLVFILILKAFGSGKSSSKNTPVAAPLISYATTDTTMQLTIDGPVVANQNHKALQIDVGQNQSQIDIMQGYQGTVTNTQTIANNQQAYTNFLEALNIAGYTKGVVNTQLSDYRGYCPGGNRYLYQIISPEDKITQQYWSTSCGNPGTFRGSVGTVISLFERQIPNYGSFTQNTDL